jgi:hypothetical protein
MLRHTCAFLCFYKQKCATRVVIQGNLNGKKRCYLLAVIMKYQVMLLLKKVEWANMISKCSLQRKSTKIIWGRPCFFVSRELTALTIFSHCLFVGHDLRRYTSKHGPCFANFWMRTTRAFCWCLETHAQKLGSIELGLTFFAECLFQRSADLNAIKIQTVCLWNYFNKISCFECNYEKITRLLINYSLYFNNTEIFVLEFNIYIKI